MPLRATQQLLRLLFISLLCLNSSVLLAQVTASITGQITDNTGATLPGASVYIEGTTQGATTDMDGYYEITEVAPGTYNLIASFIGFDPQTKFNIQVRTAGNQSYDFVLESSSTTLQEVVVTVDQNVVSRPKETPLSAQTLTAVELSTYPGGNNDVVRVAQSLPGISPSSGGFRNDLIIRGGAPNETVYYLDGMEIPNINHFATQGGSGGPVGMLNVSFINEVTLSTSAFNAQYDNPLSGVLQFDQRVGDTKKASTNIRVSASETALTFNGPLFKGDNERSKTSVIASVRRSYLQFLFELIGLPIRPDYWDYQFKVTHQIDDRNTLNLMALGAIDKFSLEGDPDLDSARQVTFDTAPFINQYSNATGISWRHRFAERVGYMETVLSTNTLINDFKRYTDNENQEGIFFSNDSRETEVKLRHMQKYFLDEWQVSGGFNVQRSIYSNTTADVPSGFLYETDLDFYKYGLFVNLNRSLFENRLELNLGIRADDDTYLEGTDMSDTFSPRASLSYNLTDRWRLNGTVGRYYKLPPYTVLGFQREGELINRDNKYIRSDHAVVGVERSFGASTSVSIEGFYKWYDDYPVSVVDDVSLANKGAGFEVLGNEEIRSIGRGESRGIEFLVQQKLKSNLYGILSYTYFISEFSGSDRSVLRPSLWDSRHLASFTGGYQLKRNWEVSSRLRYAGPSPFVPTDLETTAETYPRIVLDFGRLGDETLRAFAQLDLRVDKKWFAEKFSIDLFFEFQNLLGRANPTPPEYGLVRGMDGQPATPRELFLLPEEEGSFIPSIGLVLDF